MLKIIQKSKDHLAESGMSYWDHLRHSILQSSRLVLISYKSIIHGVFPWIYNSAGPIGIYKIYKEIKKMKHVQKMYSNYDNE